MKIKFYYSWRMNTLYFVDPDTGYVMYFHDNFESHSFCTPRDLKVKTEFEYIGSL